MNRKGDGLMRQNIRIARELVRIAKELAGSNFDMTQSFQKAISKPTSQNVSKFVKTIPKISSSDDDQEFDDMLDSVKM